MKEAYVGKELMETLDSALAKIDVAIFEGDPTHLMHLANDMLAKLDPQDIPLTKETYPTHGATLFALHQALICIKKVANRQLDSADDHGVYQRYKEALENIAKERHYYPYCYQAMLIGQSLKMLEKEGPSSVLLDGCRRFFFGAYGILCAMQGVRSLAAFEFDHGAFESALSNVRTAVGSRTVKNEKWHDDLLDIYQASLKAIRQPKFFAAFKNCVQEKCTVALSMKKSARKALRYGVIDQIRMLCIHGPTNDVRSESLGLLLNLGERSVCERSACDGWGEDSEIFEALLDALLSVHGELKRNEAAAVVVALETMIAAGCHNKGPFDIESWLGSKSLAEKLSSPLTDSEPVVSKSLFDLAVEHIEVFRQQRDIEKFRDEIRSRYQEPSFTTASSMFDGQPAKHVKLMRSQLMLLEADHGEESDDSSMEELDLEHQPTVYRARLGRIKNPIPIRELFEDRCLEPGHAAQRITKVLLVGNPGTGKTTLSRKLAYLWSTGDWGNQFRSVYLLPVRRLQAKDYDDLTVRREKSLATAIANICFLRKNDEEEFRYLVDSINDDLKSTSTLVILDGLDEGAAACDEILHQAKYGDTSLLMLSRPYGMHDERKLIDIEVECIGMNDKQLLSYIYSDLVKEKARLLERFLTENKAVWEIAHVPVNTLILCFLWKEEAEVLQRERINGSILLLYRSMTHFVWDRFVEKYEIKNAQRSIAFEKLGAIGFDALHQGQIIISQYLVHEHIDEVHLDEVVKNCAFLLLELAGSDYQFPHLTFQEYFAACHLATNLLEGGDSAQMVSRFVTANKYYREYRVMLCFMAEEVSRSQGAEGFRRMLAAVDADQVEVFGFQHAVLKLRLVEGFLAVTKRKGKYETLCLETAEPIVKVISQFLTVLGEKKELHGLINEVLSEVSNICSAFPKYIRSLLDKVKRTFAGKKEETIDPQKLSFSHDSGELSSPHKKKWTAIRASKKFECYALSNSSMDASSSIDLVTRKTKFSNSLLSDASSIDRDFAEENMRLHYHMLLSDEFEENARAIRDLPRLAQACPERAEELILMHFAQLRESRRSQIGQLILEQIPSLNQSLPEKTAFIARHFRKVNYQLLDNAGRRMYVMQIPQLIIACPAQEQKLAELGRKACKIKDRDVRIGFAAELAKSLGEVPQSFPLLHKIGSLLSNDRSDEVRRTMRDEFNKLSLRTLIDILLTEKNNIVLQCIVPRLLHNALTVKGSRNKPTMSLVLHTSPLEVVRWDLTSKEVLTCVSCIKKNISKAFPNLPKGL